ncbi:NADPH-dependent F420 reductase [Paraburkholderia flagellata]|uniref:NADPH-dependent F420 reductase n=1 Tax=Paraburkholderia flagellata TaxID=2883241 RepID=UPI001F4475B7|nr:NADPH-dependent F420 reductase [Paraburkholderia flagellata]
MKVAIIGTGNMGSALAAVLATAGHKVSIAAREQARAKDLAERVGHGAVAVELSKSANDAEVVILAVPYEALVEAARAAGNLEGKVVIDISNPITADYKDLLIGHTTSAAEQLQSAIPGAKVVKAFNTVFARLLAPEARQSKALQTFIAGDDTSANELVSSLAKSAGFEPVESGPLSNSRFIEPIGEMNIHFGYFLGKGPNVAPAWAAY